MIDERHAGGCDAEVVEARRPIHILNNMSCRASARVNHTGRENCIRLRFDRRQLPGFLESEVDYGPGMESGIDPVTARNLLESRRRIALEPCPELKRLPPVAGVLINAPGDSRPGLTDVQRVVVAVLARSTRWVFLRDSRPVAISDRFDVSVTLLIPTTWRFNA